MKFLPANLKKSLFSAAAVLAISLAPAAADEEMANLDPDLAHFLELNAELIEQYRQQDSKPLTQEYAIIMVRWQETNIAGLEFCAERWQGFEGLADEARRRVRLLRGTWVVKFGMPVDALALAEADAARILSNTAFYDMMAAQSDAIHADCTHSMAAMFAPFNFAQ